MRGEQWGHESQLSSKAAWGTCLSLSHLQVMVPQTPHSTSDGLQSQLVTIQEQGTLACHISWTVKELTGSSQAGLMPSHHEYITTSTNFKAMLIPRHHFPGGTRPPAAGQNCHFRDGEVIWHLQDSSLRDCQQLPLCNYSQAEWPWVKASGRTSVCGIWWQLDGDTRSHQPQLWKWFWEGKAMGLGRLKISHDKEKGRKCQQGRAWFTLLLCLVTMLELVDAAWNRELAMEIGTNSLYICGFDRLSNEQSALQHLRSVKKIIKNWRRSLWIWVLEKKTTLFFRERLRSWISCILSPVLPSDFAPLYPGQLDTITWHVQRHHVPTLTLH